MGDLDDRWDEVLTYMTHKSNCETSYRDVSLHGMTPETLMSVVAYYSKPENSFESIQAEAYAGNGYAKLEVALQ